MTRQEICTVAKRKPLVLPSLNESHRKKPVQVNNTVRQSMKPKIIAALSGVCWSVCVALIIKDAAFWGHIAEVRWIACITGPLVGLGVYISSRWTFKKPLWLRIVWSAVSLYCAAAAYAVLLGVVAFLVPFHGATKPAGEIGVEALAFMWGITFIPLLWAAFPLSFLNHQLLRLCEKTA